MDAPSPEYGNANSKIRTAIGTTIKPKNHDSSGNTFKILVDKATSTEIIITQIAITISSQYVDFYTQCQTYNRVTLFREQLTTKKTSFIYFLETN